VWQLRVIETPLPGLLVIEPKVFGDDRGFFLETYEKRRYREAGIPEEFVQDNLSFSRQGVLRGLHFQNPDSQGKLVYVLQGEVFDVAVDIRVGSPTFGRWHGVTLSGENKKQLWVPVGFAHGFCVTGDTALFAYKCTDYYAPQSEVTIRWDDPAIAIDWPVKDPELSEKDGKGVLLDEVDDSLLFPFK
jgi:dTDP-4-dehydrorhamnose 3,5-epimerase